MLPQDGGLSTSAVVTGFPYPVKSPLPEDKLQDWELAGVGLNDPSQGLLVKVWRASLEIDPDTEVGSVYVEAEDVAKVLLFSGADITEVALAFDQNMNPFVAYMQGSTGKFYWYDPTVPGMTHTSLPAGCYDLRCTMDERRPFNIANSDIVLSYLRAGNLCIRYQRERYETEHVLKSGVGANCQLISMARNRGQRLQWRLRNYELRDDPNALFRNRPILAEIISDVCRRVGITDEQIDVNDLWNIEVGGYLVASQQTPANIISQLQGIYPFDVCEHDGKIHFYLRGRSPVARINVEELGERPGKDTFEIKEVQEVELLRRLTLHYKDETRRLGDNMASAERRATTINAEGDQQTEAPITMTPSEAKRAVENGINSQWAERYRHYFNLTKRHGFLTVGDVIEVVDIRGDINRIRITKMLWQDNIAETEAVNDAPWSYDSEWTVSTSPNTGTGGNGTDVPLDPDFVVMNLPSWDGSDEIGFYLAAWSMSTRGGEIYTQVPGQLTSTYMGDVLSPATVGVLIGSLLPEVGPEYLSNQKINMAMIGDTAGLTQMDYDELLQYNHLAAIQYDDGTWGIFQFEDATRESDGTYTLSNVIQGRFDTKPKAASEGAMIVMLDDDVTFVQVPDWYKDLALQVRVIDEKTLSDEGDFWITPTLTPWRAQQEWAPVSLSRDGDVLSWIPRPRLGVEVNPLQSKYFSGYRITYSDAFTVDVGPDVTSYTRAVSPGTTVTVAALNSITGPGPNSEVFTL